MNQYIYNNYGPGSSSSSTSSQQYSPPISNGVINNSSPTFNYDNLGSSISSMSSTYSINNPRLRYYLSKSFDLEDDLEFCPEIPDHFNTSPTIKKFNPYTASVFSPNQSNNESPQPNHAQSPRVSTPRVRKPIEIINPQTKLKISSPSIPK
ncbi:hypothetical protein CLIB1444_10S01750 [[Candida] jaroonii]|uniref:Uncharacterized protein n=1 Tax=[Candida] jaroonii TaxID=467808 RepID=A0ACA9YBZ1_9ASCO|nr:hypothetical protein CLIB1444_10S01750 [[Candida] jaroonii]